MVLFLVGGFFLREHFFIIETIKYCQLNNPEFRKGVDATFRLRVFMLFFIHFFDAFKRRLKPAATKDYDLTCEIRDNSCILDIYEFNILHVKRSAPGAPLGNPLRLLFSPQIK